MKTKKITLVEEIKKKSGQTKKYNPLMSVYPSIDHLPLKRNEELEDRPDIFATDGAYYVKYLKCTTTEDDGRAFYVRCDFIINSKKPNLRRLRYYSWEDFKKVAEKNPLVKWLLDYSNISKTTFRVSKQNPAQAIPFTIDFEKYFADAGRDTVFHTNTLLSQATQEIKDRKMATIARYQVMKEMESTKEALAYGN